MLVLSALCTSMECKENNCSALPVRILTWNVNSLPALLSSRLPAALASLSSSGLATFEVPSTLGQGKRLAMLLVALEADIIALQETKITRGHLTPDMVSVPGFTAYYSCAQYKKGYSGVVTFCRNGADCNCVDATPVSSSTSLLSNGLLRGYGTFLLFYQQSESCHLIGFTTSSQTWTWRLLIVRVALSSQTTQVSSW